MSAGDCRLVPAMQGHPALQALRGKATLILDTTYCDPRYTFPSQQEVLAYALRAFAAESSANPRTLFLFGTYTIGKERLFLEVARAANKKVTTTTLPLPQRHHTRPLPLRLPLSSQTYPPFPPFPTQRSQNTP